MPKLTLSADTATVTLAKRLAAQQGTSVSHLFSRFVLAVAAQQRQSGRLGPLTRRSQGLVNLPEGTTDRSLLEDALLDRHGITA